MSAATPTVGKLETPEIKTLASLISAMACLLVAAPLGAADPPSPVDAGSAKGAGIRTTGTNMLVNSLGMRFSTVPGTKTRVSVFETRVGDYQVFCEATDHQHSVPDFKQEPNHPVVNVNWEDAQAFCRWLTGKERNEGRLGPGEKYRLPTDHEWNLAAGLGTETGVTPEQRMKSQKIWPWGHYWPPQSGDGNYGAALKVDNFPATSPAGSFKPNAFGIFDLGGNVWEWCEDWYNEAQVTKVLRGGSFNDVLPGYLLTAYRFSATMNLSNEDIGFRVVLGEE